MGFYHGLINCIDTKVNRRHLKKLTCKGTLRQVLVCIRVHRLEVQSAMLLFSTQLDELLPLSPSLWFNFPPFPLPCVNKYTGGRGFWGSRPQTDKHLPQSPFTGQFFK